MKSVWLRNSVKGYKHIVHEKIHLQEELIVDCVEIVLDDEVKAFGAAWYMFKRDLPPQYSRGLSLQTMLQLFTLGTLLVWLTDPALITLPQ
jgi:hypothetical protein